MSSFEPSESPTPAIDLDDEATALDLDAVEAELAAVEASLERLDAGTYGICEVTGAELPDAVLELDPTARRATHLTTT